MVLGVMLLFFRRTWSGRRRCRQLVLKKQLQENQYLGFCREFSRRCFFFQCSAKYIYSSTRFILIYWYLRILDQRIQIDPFHRLDRYIYVNCILTSKYVVICSSKFNVAQKCLWRHFIAHVILGFLCKSRQDSRRSFNSLLNTSEPR